MTRHIIYFKGTFNGLYKWGKGWDMETRAMWKEYWRNVKGVFWKYFNHKTAYEDIDYLVTNGGSIFLHPMGFNGGLFDCGVLCGGSYFGSEIEQLKRLCEECAKVCGGTFTMETSEELPMAFELEEIE